MDCPSCCLPFAWDDGIQFLPCLHIVCFKCYEQMCKFTKTCPFPYCFSPLRLNPDMRLNKCDNKDCRRRMAPVCELILLTGCTHQLCGECEGELFRGRRAAFCPSCESPVPAEGEESCDACTAFTPTEKMTQTACCQASVCPSCAEKRAKSAEGPRCADGKCPKKKKKRSKESAAEEGAVPRCSCGLTCENEPLANFPSENECDHEVCIECLGRMLEANEKSKVVPCCPNEMCRVSYRSESVLSLRMQFPDRMKYFENFEVGYHIGYEKLKDDTALLLDANTDLTDRIFTIRVAIAEDEDNAVPIDFDKTGSFGDLLREARRALKIGMTDKVYGYYLRIDGEDRVIVANQEMIQQDVTTAGVLRATMVMVDMNGIVSANRHTTQPPLVEEKKKKK